MILSDNDIDAIEDYYDNNNVGEYEKQMIDDFKGRLLAAINKKIERIDELLNNILKPWEEDERKVKHLDQNDAEKAALEAIKVYCADYKVNYHEVANDEIAEFCKELLTKERPSRMYRRYQNFRRRRLLRRDPVRPSGNRQGRTF